MHSASSSDGSDSAGPTVGQSPADTHGRAPKVRPPAMSDGRRGGTCRAPRSRAPHFPLATLQQRTQAFGNATRVELPRGAARDHHDVEPVVSTTQPVPAASEPLAHGALHPVARHRVADFATRGDAQPHSRRRHGSRWSNEDHELARGESTSLRGDTSIVARCPQSIRPRETAGQRCSHRYFEGVDGARRVRPFALRRLRIVRPPAVFMRERKPCLRRRRIRLGW